MQALDGSKSSIISIHALLAESDSKPRRLKSRRCVFLSTLSLRRATYNLNLPSKPIDNFYPRSPCGERLILPIRRPESALFLSTLSLRRATLKGFAIRWNTCISIHALLAESDSFNDGRRYDFRDFYPRSPCGERPHNIRNNCIDCCISIHALLAESDFAVGR